MIEQMIHLNLSAQLALGTTEMLVGPAVRAVLEVICAFPYLSFPSHSPSPMSFQKKLNRMTVLSETG